MKETKTMPIHTAFLLTILTSALIIMMLVFQIPSKVDSKNCEEVLTKILQNDKLAIERYTTKDFKNSFKDLEKNDYKNLKLYDVNYSDRTAIVSIDDTDIYWTVSFDIKDGKISEITNISMYTN